MIILLAALFLLGTSLIVYKPGPFVKAAPAVLTNQIVNVTTFPIPYTKQTLVYGWNNFWENHFHKVYADTWIRFEFEGQVQLNSSFEKSVQVMAYANGYPTDSDCDLSERNKMISCSFSHIWKEINGSGPLENPFQVYLVDLDPFVGERGDTGEFNPSLVTITEYYPSFLYLPILSR